MHRRKCDPDTDGDAHLRAIDLVNVGNLANDASREELRLVLMLDAGLKHDEFVSADPAYHIVAAHRSNKALCDLNQHRIADWVPELIIDGLEPVQIEIMEGNLLIVATRCRSGQK